MIWLNLLKIIVDFWFQSSIIMIIEKGDALNFKEEISMKKFNYVMRMINEATILKGESYHVLCVEDEDERYILKADWNNSDGVPTLYILYDNVRGDGYIYYEVREINRQEIFHLLEVWNEIASSFGEE